MEVFLLWKVPDWWWISQRKCLIAILTRGMLGWASRAAGTVCPHPQNTALSLLPVLELLSSKSGEESPSREASAWLCTHCRRHLCPSPKTRSWDGAGGARGEAEQRVAPLRAAFCLAKHLTKPSQPGTVPLLKYEKVQKGNLFLPDRSWQPWQVSKRNPVLFYPQSNLFKWTQITEGFG